MCKINTFCCECNCYSIEINNEIAIIDPGSENSLLTNFVKENCSKIKYILLTHSHFDHISGVKNILNYCKAPVVIHNQDKIGLNNAQYNLSSNFGLPNVNIKADIIVKDGDCLNLGGEKIKVMHTPGHTFGSVIYFINKYAFCGDTVFCGSIGRTDFITSSPDLMQKSLQKIKNIKEDYILYPGHNQPTTLNIEKENNIYF